MMKQAIFKNWNFMRLLRLGLGIIVVVQSVLMKDTTMGILGILFTALPVFNIGCCGAGGCAGTFSKENNGKPEDISYEEVK